MVKYQNVYLFCFCGGHVLLFGQNTFHCNKQHTFKYNDDSDQNNRKIFRRNVDEYIKYKN